MAAAWGGQARYPCNMDLVRRGVCANGGACQDDLLCAGEAAPMLCMRTVRPQQLHVAAPLNDTERAASVCRLRLLLIENS